MRKLAFPTAIIGASFAFFAFTILNVNWNIDSNYSIKFVGTRAEGTFSGLIGTVTFDANDLAHASIDVQVSTATIKTGNATKDEHAKGASWFDAAQYPNIRFQSTAISKSGTGFLATGNLMLHGITKAVSIPFQFTNANGKGVFSGNLTIKRKDFGINGNSFGFLVGNDFAIELRVPVKK